MARTLNPRRELLARLGPVHKHIRELVWWWQYNSKRTVWVTSDEAGSARAHARPREPHEYPEAQIKEWRNVVIHAQYVRVQMDAIEQFANEQIKRLKNEYIVVESWTRASDGTEPTFGEAGE